MRYDLIACFYKEANDTTPAYTCPLGVVTNLGWDPDEWGFKEDPDSTPGYLDYIKKDFFKDDLKFITQDGYESEVMDVLYNGEDFGRIDVLAREIDTIDDEGTLPPFGLFISDTFVKFTTTEPLSPVLFIDGNPYEMTGSTRTFSIPLKKLKDYFDVLTMYEVKERLQTSFAEGSPWSFDELKDYMESGFDDAVDLTTRTLFGLRGRHGEPLLRHALSIGLAGRDKNEQIVGFLYGAVVDGGLEIDMLTAYGFSKEVSEALRLLTSRKRDEGFEDFVLRLATSSDFTALNVYQTSLRHDSEDERSYGGKVLTEEYDQQLEELKEVVRLAKEKLDKNNK